MALPFIRALRNPTLQQDNAQPLVVGIIQTFLDTENVRLSSWPVRSSDLLPVENVWFMVAECHHYMPFTTFDIVWKLHGHLYLYLPSDYFLTQRPGI
ncbi:hypothetical protein TNCV_4391791 [Trichonephila clavipes]|nr:hypothetical protein TNCV_4391791 [Trichonephila clavipes]